MQLGDLLLGDLDLLEAGRDLLDGEEPALLPFLMSVRSSSSSAIGASSASSTSVLVLKPDPLDVAPGAPHCGAAPSLTLLARPTLRCTCDRDSVARG